MIDFKAGKHNEIIYSASNYSALATYKDAYYFVKKQAIGIALGSVVMVLTCIFDYNKLKNHIDNFKVWYKE